MRWHRHNRRARWRREAAATYRRPSPELAAYAQRALEAMVMAFMRGHVDMLERALVLEIERATRVDPQAWIRTESRPPPVKVR